MLLFMDRVSPVQGVASLTFSRRLASRVPNSSHWPSREAGPAFGLSSLNTAKAWPLGFCVLVLLPKPVR